MMRIKKIGDWRGESVFCLGPGHFRRTPYRGLQALILAGWRNKANFRDMESDDGMDVGLKAEFSKDPSEKTEKSTVNSGRELSDEEFVFEMERKTRLLGEELSSEELQRYEQIMRKEKM